MFLSWGQWVLEEGVPVHRERDVLHQNLVHHGQPLAGGVVPELPGADCPEFADFAKDARSLG